MRPTKIVFVAFFCIILVNGLKGRQQMREESQVIRNKLATIQGIVEKSRRGLIYYHTPQLLSGYLELKGGKMNEIGEANGHSIQGWFNIAEPSMTGMLVRVKYGIPYNYDWTKKRKWILENLHLENCQKDERKYETRAEEKVFSEKLVGNKLSNYLYYHMERGDLLCWKNDLKNIYRKDQVIGENNVVLEDLDIARDMIIQIQLLNLKAKPKSSVLVLDNARKEGLMAYNYLNSLYEYRKDEIIKLFRRYGIKINKYNDIIAVTIKCS